MVKLSPGDIHLLKMALGQFCLPERDEDGQVTSKPTRQTYLKVRRLAKKLGIFEGLLQTTTEMHLKEEGR